MNISTTIMSGLAAAIKCIEVGEIEFCRIKLEILRALQISIVTQVNPESASHDVILVMDKENNYRVSIVLRILREIFLVEGALESVHKRLALYVTRTLIEHLYLSNVYTVQELLAQAAPQIDSMIVKNGCNAAFYLDNLNQPTDHFKNVVELAEAALFYISRNAETLYVGENLNWVEVLGAFDICKVYHRCPILGLDEDRAKRMDDEGVELPNPIRTMDNPRVLIPQVAMRLIAKRLTSDFELLCRSMKLP